MMDYKTRFIKLLIDSGALLLANPKDPEGLFTLKSGRRSPFFLNMGILNSAKALKEIGVAYAEAVHEHFGDKIDVIYGPAYKAIPLSVLCTTQLGDRFGMKDVSYCFDRKEVKDHGDGGGFCGAKLCDGDRLVIVEDVTTSGKSIDESVDKILSANPNVDIKGMVSAVNRLEYGTDKTKTALEEIAEKYNMEAYSIVTMEEVLKTCQLPEIELKKFYDYYYQYGPKGRVVI